MRKILRRSLVVLAALVVFMTGAGVMYAANEYGPYQDKVYSPMGDMLAWRGCVIRFEEGQVHTAGWFDSGGPYIHANSAHIAAGCEDVWVDDGGDLVIDTDGMAPVASSWVSGDETLSARGIFCGASVGAVTTIRCHKVGTGRLYFNQQSHWDAISCSYCNAWVGWLSVVERPA